MNLSKIKVNFEYFLVQAVFWMGVCTISGFAAVYLQGRGYNNTELGLILCLGNAGGLIFSPVLASLVDKYGKLDNIHTYWAMLLLQIISLALLSLMKGKSLSMSAVYVLLLTCNAAAQPMVTQLSFELERSGHHINFGAARSGGSVAYAILVTAMGTIVSHLGCKVIIAAGLIVLSVEAVLLAVITYQLCRAHLFGGALPSEGAAESKSLGGFIADNRRFSVLLIGMALIYFSHSALTNFLINVVNNVGGDTVTFGRISAFAAVAELPAMLLADRLSTRFRLSSLIRFSLIAFTVKALAVAAASTVPALYAALAIQALSYAVLTPILVRYVEKVISSADAAKGQSLAYSSLVLGSIFSGFIVGSMFDSVGVTATMLVCAAISLAGTLICMPAVENTPAPQLTPTNMG